MGVKSKTLWVVLIVAGCAAVLPWGCASDSESEAEAHFKQGVDHAQKGEWNAAIDCFTKAIELNPRGNAYTEMAKYDAAIRDYTKAIELDPQPLRSCAAVGVSSGPVFPLTAAEGHAM